MNNDNWLLNISKIEDNHMWILKLIASDKNTLSVLGNHNIELDTINAFVISNKFYTNVSNTQDKIIKIMSEDPMTIIASFIKLKEKFNDDIKYISDFLSNLDMTNFRGYLKGSKIENKHFILNNVGFSNERYTDYETFNKQIDKYIKKVSSLENLSTNITDSLKISSKSGIEWTKIDYLKHALGTPGDIVNLSLNLLKYEPDSTMVKKKEPIQFIKDIFQVYKWDEIESLLQQTFYTNTSFSVPTWKNKDDTITKINIGNLDKESKKDVALTYKVSELLLEYDNYKVSGVTETLVLIVYNLLYSVIYRYKYLYNQFKEFIDKPPKENKNKLTIREKEVIQHSLKSAIDSLEKLINIRVKEFFGLDDKYSEYGIDKISDISLYPEEKKVSSKSIFRVMGGIKSITKKESCNEEVYPIVIDKDVDGVYNGKLNMKETQKRLIKLLLGDNDEYVGGIIMSKEVALRTFDIIKLYLNDVIDAKRKGIVKIDTYFNKMISGIKLQKAKGIATQLQTAYTKIITEDNKLIKKTLIIETVSNIVEYYKDLRNKEYEKIKDYLEIYETIEDYSERNNNNNVILNSNEGRKKLKKLADIQRKLLLEYFVAKNTAYVYKLLALHVLDAIKLTVELKTNKNVLPDNIKNSLNKNFNNINENINSRINSINALNGINNLQNKKVSINSTNNTIANKTHLDGGRNKRPFDKLLVNKKPKEIEKIMNKQYWLDLEYHRLGGKKIFIPFYNNRSLLNPSGYLNIIYGPREGKLDKKEKFIKSNSAKSLSKMCKNGLIIVCNRTSEIKNPKQWRLLDRDFLLDIEKGGISNIRKKIYNLIASNNDYLKATNIWKNNESKLLLYNVCKQFGKNMLKCQLIISREELAKQLHIRTPAK